MAVGFGTRPLRCLGLRRRRERGAIRPRSHPARLAAGTAGSYARDGLSWTFAGPGAALRSRLYTKGHYPGSTETVGAHARGRVEIVCRRPLRTGRADVSETAGIESARSISDPSIRPDSDATGQM